MLADRLADALPTCTPSYPPTCRATNRAGFIGFLRWGKLERMEGRWSTLLLLPSLLFPLACGDDPTVAPPRRIGNPPTSTDAGVEELAILGRVLEVEFESVRIEPPNGDPFFVDQVVRLNEIDALVRLAPVDGSEPERVACGNRIFTFPLDHPGEYVATVRDQYGEVLDALEVDAHADSGSQYIVLVVRPDESPEICSE